MVSPAKQERVLRTQSGFCSPEPVAVWGKGPPKERTFILTLGRGPDSIRGGGLLVRDSDGLGALCYSMLVPLSLIWTVGTIQSPPC